MRLVYPVDLREEDGVWRAYIPGISSLPLGSGKTVDKAIDAAWPVVSDTLNQFPDVYHIPKPMKAAGFPALDLPILIAAKVAVVEAMAEKGISIKDLSEKTGISSRDIRRFFMIETDVTIATLQTILRAVGLKATFSFERNRYAGEDQP